MKNDYLSSKLFGFMMHGHSWKYVIDQNTELIDNFARSIGSFYDKNVCSIKNEVMITASRKDDLIPDVEDRLKEMNLKMKNCRLVLFEKGNHPAMLSNSKEFRSLVLEFLK